MVDSHVHPILSLFFPYASSSCGNAIMYIRVPVGTKLYVPYSKQGSIMLAGFYGTIISYIGLIEG